MMLHDVSWAKSAETMQPFRKISKIAISLKIGAWFYMTEKNITKMAAKWTDSTGRPLVYNGLILWHNTYGLFSACLASQARHPTFPALAFG